LFLAGGLVLDFGWEPVAQLYSCITGTFLIH